MALFKREGPTDTQTQGLQDSDQSTHAQRFPKELTKLYSLAFPKLLDANLQRAIEQNLYEPEKSRPPNKRTQAGLTLKQPPACAITNNSEQEALNLQTIKPPEVVIAKMIA
eukprot:4563153-Amphidinium_carterae.1